jgi:RNA polymerase sigma factor (sigma-70 family)
VIAANQSTTTETVGASTPDPRIASAAGTGPTGPAVTTSEPSATHVPGTHVSGTHESAFPTQSLPQLSIPEDPASTSGPGAVEVPGQQPTTPEPEDNSSPQDRSQQGGTQPDPPSSAVRRRQDVGDLVVRAGAAFEEYRQGVPGSIDTLVRLVTPLLWHTARQCGLTAAEAEDVVQQTFLSLVRSKDSISDPLAVVRWLTVSLRRLAWRERSNSAKRSNEEPTDDDLPRAPSAEHTAVLTDQQQRLWSMVSELSERCRKLLAVIAFAPRPDYAAIAVDLGIPVGSIGPTRGRCLAKLRARLDGGDWT